MEKITAILLASGMGNRMKSDFPKPFLKASSSTLLETVLDKFSSSALFSDIIITCQTEFREKVNNMARQLFKKNHWQVVTGGATRFDSVLCALKSIPDTKFVLVHDVARPCFSLSLLQRICKGLGENEAVIPVLPAINSIYQLQDQEVRILDKLTIRQVQTPQGFDSAMLKAAYLRAEADNNNSFADDFSVWLIYGPAGYKFIPGEIENIKVTYPGDLRLAEFYLDSFDS